MVRRVNGIPADTVVPQSLEGPDIISAATAIIEDRFRVPDEPAGKSNLNRARQVRSADGSFVAVDQSAPPRLVE